MDNVHDMTKLQKIQQELSAPKNQKNSFGNYNYRSCEDILQAVKPLLNETGTVLNLMDEMVEVGGRVYVKATVTLLESETGRAIASAVAFAREEESKKGMDASQVTGAASSYARKYALSGLFAIDDNKDSDATNTGGKEPPMGAYVDTLQKMEQKSKQRQAPPPPDIAPALGESPDGQYICDCCGMPISPVKKKNGEVWSPKAIASWSIAEFDGRQYCSDCAKKEMERGR